MSDLKPLRHSLESNPRNDSGCKHSWWLDAPTREAFNARAEKEADRLRLATYTPSWLDKRGSGR